MNCGFWRYGVSNKNRVMILNHCGHWP
jgi:hypothetical protein